MPAPAEVNISAMQEFVAALRSGKYQQTRRNLAIKLKDGTTRYCCLGVACVLAEKAGVDVRFVPATNNPDVNEVVLVGTNVNNNYDVSVLPTVVADYFGISTNPDIICIGPEGKFTTTATDANDEHWFDFDIIADAFERTYLLNTTDTTTVNESDDADQ